ncbi:MAG TPA: Xaa-Pro peptidase family protein [Anaerolineaceae bacterium]|nr:Xaa-Pro peptidase family protein [Anaerolineaceae bacterium]
MMPFTHRLETLYASMKKVGIDTLTLNPGPNLAYLTGLHFHLSERPTLGLFTPGKKPALILPALETNKVASNSLEMETFPFGDNPADWNQAYARAAKNQGLEHKKIGVEPVRLRVLELRFLEEAAPGAEIVSADEVLSSLRICKEPGEIQNMRQAVTIAQNALNATLPLIKIGMTERQLASELTLQLMRAGSDGELPFQPIVAGGPNSANPHAVPTNRKFQPGDLVVIDWGASYQDYFSDLTRTFAIAEISTDLAEVVQVVAQANAAGRAAGKPGIEAGQVDQVTRKVIEDAGLGEYFIHRTGHGLGMESHEAPYIYGENSFLLSQGMAYTIEPGIYIPGQGGVRIEDDVVVTRSGSESLSNLIRELIVVG